MTGDGTAGGGRLSSGSNKYGSPSWSSSQRSSYEERCVDPVAEGPSTKSPHKAAFKDANGKHSETVGFISGPAEPSPAAQTCGPCASPRSCRTFVCSVLTCGLYRVCQRSVLAPCLPPDESSPDEAEKISLRDVKQGGDKEEDAVDWLEDLCIAGVKVQSPKEYLEVRTKPSPPQHQRQSAAAVATQPGLQSLHQSMQFEDWEDSEEDVDSLISKKLLELFSEYQIEELARCTTDSVFLRKSKDINQLINSVAEEHKMDEQEAECRLVRGIIRISTRRSTKKRPAHPRRERTLSDSGNDTMRDSEASSFSNNSKSDRRLRFASVSPCRRLTAPICLFPQDDYKSNPNFQISELTSSDKCARELWRHNGGKLQTSRATTATSFIVSTSSDSRSRCSRPHFHSVSSLALQSHGWVTFRSTAGVCFFSSPSLVILVWPLDE